MIITCPECGKNFQIDSALIPENGRNLKCGSCDHVWFYRKTILNDELINVKNKLNNDDEEDMYTEDIAIKTPKEKNKSSKKIVVYKNNNKKSLKLSNILSYIFVAIISFVGLIIFLDTFKSSLSNYIPNLELILFNLFETVKDILLFFEDLTD